MQIVKASSFAAWKRLEADKALWRALATVPAYNADGVRTSETVGAEDLTCQQSN